MFTDDARGMGVAFGERFGEGRTVVPALTALKSEALEKPRGLPAIEERVE